MTTSTRHSQVDPAARRLLIGGVALVVAGMVFGDLFAVFVLHQNNARIGDALFAAAQAVGQGDGATINAQFAAIGGFLENRGTKVDAHSHIVHLGYLALLLAMLQPWSAFSRPAKERLATFFLICSVLLPVSIFLIHYVGLAYSPFAFIGWASMAADASGFLLVIAVILQLAGLWRGWREGNRDPGIAAVREFERCARILLVGGSLLLASGFLYGAGYAAYVQWVQSASEVEILKSMLGHAAAADVQALNGDLGAYGGYQALRGISVAVHTHINEMGILLLLLAFLQPMVFLAARWKERWAWLALLGAAGLPLFVQLELRFGLLAGAGADSAGLLVIIALLAMLVGLLRGVNAPARVAEKP